MYNINPICAKVTAYISREMDEGLSSLAAYNARRRTTPGRFLLSLALTTITLEKAVV